MDEKIISHYLHNHYKLSYMEFTQLSTLSCVICPTHHSLPDLQVCVCVCVCVCVVCVHAYVYLTECFVPKVSITDSVYIQTIYEDTCTVYCTAQLAHTWWQAMAYGWREGSSNCMYVGLAAIYGYWNVQTNFL